MGFVFGGQNPKEAASVADFVCGRIRQELMPYPGAIQAATVATALATYAASRYTDFSTIVDDIADLVEFHPGNAKLPMVMSKTYSNAEAESLAQDPEVASLAAGLSAGLMNDLDATERLMMRLVGEKATLMLLNKLLASLLKSIPKRSILDAVRSLDVSCATEGSQSISLVVPMAEALSAGFGRFMSAWAEIGGLSWSREGYLSMISSALVTVISRYGARIEDVADLLADRESASVNALAIHAGWHAMPDLPGEVDLGIVDQVRRLSAEICALIESGSESPAVVIAEIAAMMAPSDPLVLAARLRRAMHAENHTVRQRDGDDRISLLIGNAPAVLI